MEEYVDLGLSSEQYVDSTSRSSCLGSGCMKVDVIRTDVEG